MKYRKGKGMNEKKIRSLLEGIKDGEASIDDVLASLKTLPFEDIGYAKVDNHRALRVGCPEVIFAQGKSYEHLSGIISNMSESRETNILITRLEPSVYERLSAEFEELQYSELAKLGMITFTEQERVGNVVVATGGTSDIPVAEEAALTAEFFGNNVDRLYDVGVAGIHRLLSNRERINNANVIIAVAGMDGALPSVVAGIASVPVIAVPTSVGYGASFGGVAALLTMLNSCASGVSVVNIDNGYGAGYVASMINKKSSV